MLKLSVTIVIEDFNMEDFNMSVPWSRRAYSKRNGKLKND